MKKIGILGTHGTGKTTLSYALAVFYKNKGLNTKIVNETARSCPFPLDAEMSPEAGLWIYHSHITKELEAQARNFDICICDRTAIDSFLYLHVQSAETPMTYAVEKNAISWLETYDLLVHLVPDKEYEKTNTLFSGEEQAFRQRTQDMFSAYLADLPAEIQMKILTITSAEIFEQLSLPTAVHKIDAGCYHHAFTTV
ncbi:MAG: ATP-binding protein [Waddliaceae bacterium]|nr:ATP-binding protein [Waddliaceae bacterium]MBT3579439.1 ATP-binding protein [Waddliaceae bacterium]MBT4445154.1 ATP-binding protein [Waddliaceae bacterium]MBT6928938.1 ATP-binding protein [Waddliaceae bacterium]MBT7264476.1 ATP-binding protein [Waddliaceae bacterium]